MTFFFVLCTGMLLVLPEDVMGLISLLCPVRTRSAVRLYQTVSVTIWKPAVVTCRHLRDIVDVDTGYFSTFGIPAADKMFDTAVLIPRNMDEVKKLASALRKHPARAHVHGLVFQPGMWFHVNCPLYARKCRPRRFSWGIVTSFDPLCRVE